MKWDEECPFHGMAAHRGGRVKDRKGKEGEEDLPLGKNGKGERATRGTRLNPQITAGYFGKSLPLCTLNYVYDLTDILMRLECRRVNFAKLPNLSLLSNFFFNRDSL